MRELKQESSSERAQARELKRGSLSEGAQTREPKQGRARRQAGKQALGGHSVGAMCGKGVDRVGTGCVLG